MIAFSCDQCGMKFRVKEEFAGRSTRCPACKHRLIVPSMDRTLSAIHSGPIIGPKSALAHAGVAANVTLDGEAGGATRLGAKPVRELLAQGGGEQRFRIEGEIARGGMGAICRGVDCDIRREVAIKYLLDPGDPDKAVRFVEEAQITGQLEHPNIVPIHELGMDSQKRLFFSMKMVRGRTLAQLFDEMRANPHAAGADYTVTRLATILIGVCNALAYAHSRFVIHRDLKPGNIMIGDFGEVYVMDWGLAKVMHADDPTIASEQATVQPVRAVSDNGSATVHSSGMVSTSREGEADLTREGAIMGTPLYMPPEQALGHLREIDARSDIYSLGAILYEMLTLQPPVEKQGGFAEILPRVIRGQIVPPEERAPQRVRAGKVPRELSAMAMKALARKREDRYASAEVLRRDVELFLEGRAVSAKQDTRWESFAKLVKRNKGASAGVAGVLLVLLFSLVFIGKAWLATGRAYGAYQQEQEEKQERTRQAVPALAQAARLSTDRKEFDQAMTRVNLALEYDADHADARLLKGQLRAMKKDFAGAREELAEYLRLQPDDADARKLLELCGSEKPGEVANVLAIAQVFTRQNAPGLAEGMLREFGATAVEARRRLLELYRNTIRMNWPNAVNRLTADSSGLFHLQLVGSDQVSTLAPLEGMPLSTLSCVNGSIDYLAPLRGMPLTSLTLNGSFRGSDLSPLKGMKLTSLDLTSCAQVKDLSSLQGMPLVSLTLTTCRLIDNLSPLQGMPLVSLTLTSCPLIDDLSPLQGMPLTSLSLSGCRSIHDLSPLRGMPLKTLQLFSCALVRDLSPLKEMGLTHLSIAPATAQHPPAAKVLEGMKSLKSITVSGVGEFSIKDFWERYEKTGFKK